jgi:hypothetical protein
MAGGVSVVSTDSITYRRSYKYDRMSQGNSLYNHYILIKKLKKGYDREAAY